MAWPGCCVHFYWEHTRTHSFCPQNSLDLKIVIEHNRRSAGRQNGMESTEKGRPKINSHCHILSIAWIMLPILFAFLFRCSTMDTMIFLFSLKYFRWSGVNMCVCVHCRMSFVYVRSLHCIAFTCSLGSFFSFFFLFSSLHFTDL